MRKHHDGWNYIHWRLVFPRTKHLHRNCVSNHHVEPQCDSLDIIQLVATSTSFAATANKSPLSTTTKIAIRAITRLLFLFLVAVLAFIFHHRRKHQKVKKATASAYLGQDGLDENLGLDGQTSTKDELSPLIERNELESPVTHEDVSERFELDSRALGKDDNHNQKSETAIFLVK